MYWSRALLLCLGLIAQFSYGVEQLPVQAFASLPELQNIQLSPDGQQVAAILNVDGTSVLGVRGIYAKSFRPIAKTDNKLYVFGWFHWKNNDTVVVSVRYPYHRAGVATMETRLLAYRTDSSKPINLLARNEQRDKWVPQFQDRVIDWLPDDPAHILVAADLQAPLLLDVYQVDVGSGERKRVPSHTQTDLVRWITDRQHRVRVGVKFSGTHYEVMIGDVEQKQWRTAWSFESFGADSVMPIGFGSDPNILYVSAYHESRMAIFTVDLRNAELPLALKYANPRFDVDDDLIYSEKVGDYIGVVDHAGGGTYVFWHGEYVALSGGIDKALPNTYNRIVGFSVDESQYLLFSSGNKMPGVYYFGNRKTGELTPLGFQYPQLQSELLAGKTAVHYKARDGVEIHGYLTLPKDTANKNLPAIIFPHGGPSSADNMDFDYWTEFFANRGYAVLQMNFRGSAGYGREFEIAGLKQWGLQMQDDVTDGTEWLIGSGIADKQRICIVGASYGGYAALMGAAKTPDLYRCAISFAGVSDLRDLLVNSQNYTNKDVVTQQVGGWWTDRAQLKATSPRLLVDQIKVPVLLAHGTRDRSVPFEQSEDMANALQKGGKLYQFIRQEDGDHFLSSYEQRLQLFEAMDKFLATYLGTSTAVAPSNVESL